MARPKFASVDEYLAAVPAESRAGFDALRSIVRAALPGATEVISYQILAYRHGGRNTVWIAAFANHVSLFPVTEPLRAKLGAEVEPYISGKGTLRFGLDQPLPEALIRRVIELRAESAGASQAAGAVQEE
jgi:uncharacterized protein YdhG (YjbR/CyaY superfamily)